MKNFAKVSTTKLNEMLATEIAEDERAAIIEVLTSRGAYASSDADQTSSEDSETSSADADADFIAQLEKKDEAPEVPAKKSNKMTFEECQALAESLKGNVGHKCKVVPFNTITWEDGIIRGVVADKRSCKVLYAISVHDGRNIVKAHDSKMLQILEETGTVTRRTRTSSGAEKLEDQALMLLADELALKVGAYVEYAPTKELYIIGVDEKPELLKSLTGVIIAIVPDKRSGRILLKIENQLELFDHVSGTSKVERLITHKTSVAPDVKILDTYDEKIRAAYMARTENRAALKNLTPADALTMAKKSLEKSQNELEKLLKLIETKKVDLVETEKLYAEWVEKQATEPVENQEVTSDDVEAAEEQTEDLT